MMKVELYGDLKEVISDLIKLREMGLSVYCEFNGHKLYSDTVTLDSGYLEVTGYTYRDFLEAQQKAIKEWQEEERKAKEKARLRASEFYTRGMALIPEELASEWKECIRIRIEDLYNGAELEAAINIMEAHAKGLPTKDIVELIESQNHSGLSYSVMKSIINYFYPAAKQLFSEIKSYEESPNNNKKLS